jgi:hypothetical protein
LASAAELVVDADDDLVVADFSAGFTVFRGAVRFVFLAVVLPSSFAVPLLAPAFASGADDLASDFVAAAGAFASDFAVVAEAVAAGADDFTSAFAALTLALGAADDGVGVGVLEAAGV